MRILVLLCLVSLGCYATTSSAVAAFILEMESSASQLPGTIASINVTARSDTGTVLVSGFDLKFDIQPPAGVGRPVGITNRLNFITTGVFTLPGSVTVLASPTSDIYVNGDNGGGSNASIGAARTILFTMNFDLANNLAAGAYPILMVRPGGAFGVFDAQANDIVLPAILPQATINVAAIPEPSSTWLLGLALAGVAIRRAASRHSGLSRRVWSFLGSSTS